jgi:two-component system, NarL family, response regulator NreC
MGTAAKIRVLLVEDHQLVRQGLRKILNADPRIEVVGDVGDGESAVEAAFRLRPDVIVIDIGLPGINGIEATNRILRRMGDVAVLMLSMHGDEFYVRQSLKAGAKGYLLKDSEEVDVVRAVTAVARGESYFSSALHPLLLSGFLAQQERARA